MNIEELKEKLIKDIECYKKGLQDAECGKTVYLETLSYAYGYYKGLISGLEQALKYIEK